MPRINRRQIVDGELGEVAGETPVIVVRPDGVVRFYVLQEVDFESNGERVYAKVLQPKLAGDWTMAWARKAKGG